MTVAENVAFPLSVRGISRAEAAERVARALASVRLENFGARRPTQLSGGQQQRIALARALVFQPNLVLMDEPLGALDKKLREQMQIEIKQLQERLGLTVVFVTHDQSEALTMSDRVAVFHDGRVVQHGTPDALYRYPQNPFVAGFIGENNMLGGTVTAVDAIAVEVALAGGMRVRATPMHPLAQGTAVIVAVRPEAILLAEDGMPAENSCRARVQNRIYHGDHLRLLAETENGATLSVKVTTTAGVTAGEMVLLCWTAVDCLAFAADGSTMPDMG